ncbi:hypothetical protein [Kineosporia succinea]
MTKLRLARRRQIAGAAGLVTLIGAGVTVVGAHAAQTSTFTADFESGSTSAWSKSGGTWSVVSDGSKVLSQTSATSENAREFAGDTSWTDYTVSGRVKALSLGTGGSPVSWPGPRAPPPSTAWPWSPATPSCRPSTAAP